MPAGKKTSPRIAFVSSPMPEAEEARARLVRCYGETEPNKADVIVALGGDGLMLRTLHKYMDTGTPIYGMNRGSVGFLMNEYREDNLETRLEAAKLTILHPLSMRVTDISGQQLEALAINEVSLLRQTYQSAKLRISVDGKVRMEELICDGVLVSTPAGSTAYNLSAQGPILPLNAPLLALTPISAFRPRRWRGALLPNVAHVHIEVLEPVDRSVSAVADYTEFRDIAHVDVEEDANRSLHMLFDKDHSLDERILREQFLY